jgi:hypothetical protein
MQANERESMKQCIAKVCASRRFRVAYLLLVLGALSLAKVHATGSEDPNETLVDTAVGFLTTTFATVFTLGLGVAIAMVAKKYLRKAS